MLLYVNTWRAFRQGCGPRFYTLICGHCKTSGVMCHHGECVNVGKRSSGLSGHKVYWLLSTKREKICPKVETQHPDFTARFSLDTSTDGNSSLPSLLATKRCIRLRKRPREDPDHRRLEDHGNSWQFRWLTMAPTPVPLLSLCQRASCEKFR